MHSTIDISETETQPTAVSAPSLEPRRPRVRRTRALIVAVSILAAAVLALGWAWPRLFAPPPAPVVAASGRIEGREITLAPKDIQGRVVQLYVDEGDRVAKGQLLAELDAAQWQARRQSIDGNLATLDAQIAQARLDVAYSERTNQASIDSAVAGVDNARAKVDRARAVAANAAAEAQRARSLFTTGAISKQELDRVETARQTAEADEDAADRDLTRFEAGLALAKASADTVGLKRQQVRTLEQSRQSLLGQRAEVDAYLAERRIVAPANGTILSRPVEVGDVVTPGSPVFTMMDMSRLYLKVYIPEPDIGKLRLGDSADVTVDAFPGRTFPARISKIYDQAEFTPKNVETAEERLKLVFGVELSFVTPDQRLKPGMPADCIIHWQPESAPNSSHEP